MIWTVDVDTTQPAIARLGTALLLTGAALLPSRLIMGPLGRGVTALLLVDVPDGAEGRFRETCRPIQMRIPPRVAVCSPVAGGSECG